MPALDQKFSASQGVWLSRMCAAMYVCVSVCGSICVCVGVYLFVCLDLLAIDFDLYLSLVLAHLRFSDCF